MQGMRIALVHDYIKEYGGAEKVLEALHELYPKAPVYTSVYLPKFLGPHKDRFANWDIRTSYLQNLPFKSKLISPIRLLSKSVFKSFDFSHYDVIISSATGAYIPNVLDKKSAKLICYCHTPPRFLYGYATAREWKKNTVIRGLALVANHFLRMQDFEASENVDQYIANSEEVAGRIKKFYRRDAIVVYPPVFEDSKLEIRNSKLQEKNYYLAGGRLARPKHIDLIMKACSELEVPLKVFGKGFAGYGRELEALVGPNVELLGEVTDEEKWKLYSQAKAFISASEDEDFGIMPVESMAAGAPVIAYNSGGVKETVVQNETGLFFDELSVKCLVQAIKRFDKMKFDTEVCIKRAERFSKERFMKEIKRLVEKVEKK